MNPEEITIARSQIFTIQTPEGVSFSIPLAGPVSRFLAWLIDFFCLLALYWFANRAISVFGVINSDFSQAVGIVVFFAMNIGYAIVLEWFLNGQTIGKRLFGLRVMDNRGFRLRPSQIIIRNLLRAVDSLPICYLLGGVVCLVSRNAQRIGDVAANTIVVKKAKSIEPGMAEIFEQNRYNSLRDYPHLVARLRQKVGPQEAHLALEALLRRDELAPDNRVDLFSTMARCFKEKVAFPEAATDGISDEQYIRGVVDVLYRNP